MRLAPALALAALMSHASAQDILSLAPQKGTLQPVPNPEALIGRVTAKAMAIQELVSSFTYLQEETEQSLDSQGRAKKTTTHLYEVTHLPKGKIRRRLTRDGKPLDAAEAAKEEARIAERLRALQTAEETGKEEEKGGLQLTSRDILAVCDLGPVNRVQIQGRAAFLMGFRPRAGAKPSGLPQRLASKLEGQLLVDEATEQVIRMEGRLTESLWMGGGLLGSLMPPTTFRFEQAQVMPGLWMPVRGEFRLQARAVVVPVRQAMTFHCREFKRFEMGEVTIQRAPRP